MSPKPLRAGGEVDAYCTKCRLVLNHRIIAMVGSVPKKVECSTCGSHHLFRPRAPGDKAPIATRGSSGASPRPARTISPTRAEVAQMEHEKSWEKAVLGKAMGDFTKYTVKQTFREGQLVRHAKFGDGVVTKVIDPSKVEIAFRDETRLLAQGLSV